MSNRDCNIIACNIREAILNNRPFKIPALKGYDFKRVLERLKEV